MKKITYETLIDHLLNAVPEIKDKYEKMVEESRQGYLRLSEQDKKELEEIREMHNLPEGDPSLPGDIIVFEDLLAPFIVSLTEQQSRTSRLKEIMEWVEQVSAQEDDRVVSPAVFLCESLVTTHSSSFNSIFPYMGERTQELCRKTVFGLGSGKLDEEIKKLFEPVAGNSDLLVMDMLYDEYIPLTINPDRIISAIVKKSFQAQGVWLDLEQTAVESEDLGDILARVREAGATNIVDVIVIGDE